VEPLIIGELFDDDGASIFAIVDSVIDFHDIFAWDNCDGWLEVFGAVTVNEGSVTEDRLFGVSFFGCVIWLCECVGGVIDVNEETVCIDASIIQ